MRSAKPRRQAASALALALLAAYGCGGGNQASLAPVSGVVLLDGQPLKFGTVTFQPAQGQPARGEIQPDGAFTLSTYRAGDGAAIGRHKVRIACYTSQDPASTAAAGELLGESLVPERYTRFDSSGIEVAVLAGGNSPFEIKLESDADLEKPEDQAAPEDPAETPDATANDPE